MNIRIGAKASGSLASKDDRYLREPDGWSRRKPDIADRGGGRGPLLSAADA
jgi:hypothetical protein